MPSDAAWNAFLARRLPAIRAEVNRRAGLLGGCHPRRLFRQVLREFLLRELE